MHSLYDWDWDIPALTVPALASLGVVIGGAQRRPGRRAIEPAGAEARVGGRGPPPVRAAAACLAMFAGSVVVPRLAASRAQHALLAASEAPRPGHSAALAEALGAGRLDPLSDAGLRAASTIALSPGRARAGRAGCSLAAVQRDPTDGQAWQQLALAYQLLGDPREALAAARRALALDPRGPARRRRPSERCSALTPPASSATAAPTSSRGAG